MWLCFSAEPSPMPIEDDESPIDDLERQSEASTNSSGDHAVQTPRPDSRTKKVEKKKDDDHERLSQDLTRSFSEHLTGKGSSTQDSLTRKSLERKPYNHDILVIQTQPPKVNRIESNRIEFIVSLVARTTFYTISNSNRSNNRFFLTESNTSYINNSPSSCHRT